MQTSLFKRTVVLGIVLLFVGAGFGSFLMATVENIDTSLTYSTIQDAIDASATLNGHTLEVSSGTYPETVTVNKSLTIKGISFPYPVIEGQCPDNAVTITADDVTFTNLTVRYTGACPTGILPTGIKVESDNNVIHQNNVDNAHNGIQLSGANGNTVSKNTVTYALTSSNHLVSLLSSDDNEIYLNTLAGVNKGAAVFIGNSDNNSITANNIWTSDYGLFMFNGSDNNRIHHNNFQWNVTAHAHIQTSVGFAPCTGNVWHNGCPSAGNYWSGHSSSNGICPTTYLTPYSISGGGTSDTDNFPRRVTFSTSSITCGNVDGSPNGAIDSNDSTYLLNYLYTSGPKAVPPCSADVNGDGGRKCQRCILFDRLC